MSGRVERDAWVRRVLGVESSETGSTGDTEASKPAPDLGARLKAAGNSLRALREAQAPEAADLVVRLTALPALAKTDPAAAAASLDELESEIARATSAARARDSGVPKGRGVAYRQLLIRWRTAQQGFDANLKSLGAAVLAHPSVQADPRIAQIRQAVDALPKLVPAFSGTLEDLLDTAMNTSDPAELSRLSAQSMTAVDDYRQRLAGTARLSELEEFAQRELGAALALRGTLDAALVELKQQLAG